MRYCTPLAPLAALLLAASARSAVLYVNQTAPGPTHDGLSWQSAFITVQ